MNIRRHEGRGEAVNKSICTFQVSTVVMCLLSANVHALTRSIFTLNFSTANTDETPGKRLTAVSCCWCCDVIGLFDAVRGSLNGLLRLLMPAPFFFFTFPFFFCCCFFLSHAGLSRIDRETLVVVGCAEVKRRVKYVVSVNSHTAWQRAGASFRSDCDEAAKLHT